MKTKKLLFYLLAGLLGSCVPSLHPLYTEKELVFEEKLLGVWAENGSKWVFEKGSDPNSYDLTVIDEEGKGEFIAHLVKIDKMLFLDLFPKEPELQTNNFYKIHLLPAHTFMKVEQIEPILKMSMMDPEKIEDMLENDPNLIKHEILEDQNQKLVLTASTKELQQFMKEHAEDEGLFVWTLGEGGGELKRWKPEEPNEPNAIDPNSIDPNIIS
jgi:hypothetical protein